MFLIFWYYYSFFTLTVFLQYSYKYCEHFTIDLLTPFRIWFLWISPSTELNLTNITLLSLNIWSWCVICIISYYHTASSILFVVFCYFVVVEVQIQLKIIIVAKQIYCITTLNMNRYRGRNNKALFMGLFAFGGFIQTMRYMLASNLVILCSHPLHSILTHDF